TPSTRPRLSADSVYRPSRRARTAPPISPLIPVTSTRMTGLWRPAPTTVNTATRRLMGRRRDVRTNLEVLATRCHHLGSPNHMASMSRACTPIDRTARFHCPAGGQNLASRRVGSALATRARGAMARIGSHQTGFSIIELIVVLLVVGVLAAAAVPLYL